MSKMGVLPTEERARKMSTVQWVTMFRVISETEKSKNEIDYEFFEKVIKPTLVNHLGTQFGEQVIPLTAFVNGDAFKKVAEKAMEEAAPEAEVVSYEADLEALKIFETDIDMELTPEEQKRIDEMKDNEMRRLERLVGVEER